MTLYPHSGAHYQCQLAQAQYCGHAYEPRVIMNIVQQHPAYTFTQPPIKPTEKVSGPVLDHDLSSEGAWSVVPKLSKNLIILLITHTHLGYGGLKIKTKSNNLVKAVKKF